MVHESVGEFGNSALVVIRFWDGVDSTGWLWGAGIVDLGLFYRVKIGCFGGCAGIVF